MNIKQCLEKGFLKKIKPDKDLSDKEVNEAKYDLEKAKKTLDDEDYKWCIVKSYYSMFHAAKSVLLNMGFKEKKHVSVSVVLEELNRDGKLEGKFVNYFKAAMSAREDADYQYSYSKEIAKYEYECAKEFLEKMEKLNSKDIVVD